MRVSWLFAVLCVATIDAASASFSTDGCHIQAGGWKDTIRQPTADPYMDLSLSFVSSKCGLFGSMQDSNAGSGTMWFFDVQTGHAKNVTFAAWDMIGSSDGESVYTYNCDIPHSENSMFVSSATRWSANGTQEWDGQISWEGGYGQYWCDGAIGVSTFFGHDLVILLDASSVGANGGRSNVTRYGDDDHDNCRVFDGKTGKSLWSGWVGSNATGAIRLQTLTNAAGVVFRSDDMQGVSTYMLYSMNQDGTLQYQRDVTDTFSRHDFGGGTTAFSPMLKPRNGSWSHVDAIDLFNNKVVYTMDRSNPAGPWTQSSTRLQFNNTQIGANVDKDVLVMGMLDISTGKSEIQTFQTPYVANMTFANVGLSLGLTPDTLIVWITGDDQSDLTAHYLVLAMDTAKLTLSEQTRNEITLDFRNEQTFLLNNRGDTIRLVSDGTDDETADGKYVDMIVAAVPVH